MIPFNLPRQRLWEGPGREETELFYTQRGGKVSINDVGLNKGIDWTVADFKVDFNGIILTVEAETKDNGHWKYTKESLHAPFRKSKYCDTSPRASGCLGGMDYHHMVSRNRCKMIVTPGRYFLWGIEADQQRKAAGEMVSKWDEKTSTYDPENPTNLKGCLRIRKDCRCYGDPTDSHPDHFFSLPSGELLHYKKVGGKGDTQRLFNPETEKYETVWGFFGGRWVRDENWKEGWEDWKCE